MRWSLATVISPNDQFGALAFVDLSEIAYLMLPCYSVEVLLGKKIPVDCVS